MHSDLPLVVLLPHPDDEFAVLPFLKQATDAGRAIHLVWLTDGGAGSASPSTRAHESKRALSKSGLDSAKCRFLGMEALLPDGELHRNLGRAKRALDAELATQPDAFELWIPAWEGGHQDHDAAHALGRIVARERKVVALQYPLYRSADRWGWTFTVLSPKADMVVARRMRLALLDALGLINHCLSYRSQWRSFLGLLPIMVLRLVMLRRPVVLGEVELNGPLTRPHPGVLLYERRTPWCWLDMRDAISGLGQE